MSEYCLQKRTLSHWSYVTWYEDLAVAQRNFQIASQTGSGYSWRLVEVTVVSEKLLDGEREPQPETPVEAPQPVKSDWGSPVAQGWGKSIPIDPIKDTGHSHGLSGSVWMVHFEKKIKTRIPADQQAHLEAQGYERGSPRTEFK